MLIQADSWLVRHFPSHRAAARIDLLFAGAVGTLAFIGLGHAFPHFDPVVSVIISTAIAAEVLIVGVILRDRGQGS